MIFDFIEIGTADYRTEAEKYKKRNKSFVGLSVEPITEYYNNLPHKEDTYFKENCAISNKSGKTEIYYIKSETVKKYNLTDTTKEKWERWGRGCNSINDYHPLHLEISSTHNIPLIDFVATQEVKINTIPWLFKKYNVTKVKYLKIDTEGHDTIILNAYLDYIISTQQLDLLPRKIQFECLTWQRNKLPRNESNIKDIIKKFKKLGYWQQWPNDIVLKLKK